VQSEEGGGGGGKGSGGVLAAPSVLMHVWRGLERIKKGPKYGLKYVNHLMRQ
jgi:hypothetical protein